MVKEALADWDPYLSVQPPPDYCPMFPFTGSAPQPSLKSLWGSILSAFPDLANLLPGYYLLVLGHILLPL